MNFIFKNSKKSSFFGICILLVSLSLTRIHAQDQKYYPMGDPKKWNIELSPFVWLPVVGGEVTSDVLTEQFEVPAIDLVDNLKFAFMLSADVSKGKFFATPTYIYTKLGTENVLKTDNQGDPAVVAIPDIKMNILEFIAGMRFDIGEKVYMDPFIGFRYNNYQSSVELDVRDTSKTYSEKSDFWDPVVGLRVHYYPHPRVPLTFKSDIGGFGAGSDFAWSASVNGGYSISPSFDLLAGMLVYNVDFIEENAIGNEVGLAVFMYGFDLGIRWKIPAGYKDPAIFKHSGK